MKLMGRNLGRPLTEAEGKRLGCFTCQARREMLAAARKEAGLKGVVKAIPSVIRDTVKNPPKLRDKRNG